MLIRSKDQWKITCKIYYHINIPTIKYNLIIMYNIYWIIQIFSEITKIHKLILKRIVLLNDLWAKFDYTMSYSRLLVLYAIEGKCRLRIYIMFYYARWSVSERKMNMNYICVHLIRMSNTQLFVVLFLLSNATFAGKRFLIMIYTCILLCRSDRCDNHTVPM